MRSVGSLDHAGPVLFPFCFHSGPSKECLDSAPHRGKHLTFFDLSYFSVAGSRLAGLSV